MPKSGHNDYASISVSPRRQALRPAIAEEGVRHFEDVPLPLWSVSPRRTVSPASRGFKGGVELNTSALLESGALLSPGAGPNLSFSSPSTPSASGALVQLPPAAFGDPHHWEREYVQLRGRFLRPCDAVSVYHDHASSLNSRATMRHVCVVQPLPNLEKVQEALRRRFAAHKPASAYDAFELQWGISAACTSAAVSLAFASCASSVMDDTVSVALQEGGAVVRGAHRDQRNDTFLPAAQTWSVGGSTYDNEIVVHSGVTGQRLLRVVDPKMRVAVTALQHAPFRGFLDAQQLQVLPVREPQDVLRLKASQLVFTDYVWCGLQDGTLRLLPASHQHIRTAGPSPPYSKSPSADLVYELPRYQGGAIVSIVRSPGHDEERAMAADGVFGGARLPNRVSDAVSYMTAAGTAALDGASRRHLSLVCTASTDATVVIWDIRKVYEAVAQAQQHRHETAKGEARSHSLASAASVLTNDVITFDCSSPVPGLQDMVVRSSCTLIQVRPLAKLSGGFAGLTALRWVSSLITAGTKGGGDGSVYGETHTLDGRDVRVATRVPQMTPNCKAGTGKPARDLSQSLTRFDKREAQRAELELTEEEMQGMERELANMLPPLAAEPPQSLRVNLLVAADCLGTVHVWNLDEELHRYGCGDGGPNAAASATSTLGWPAEIGASARTSMRSLSSHSVSRSSVSYVLELSPNSTPTRQSTKRKTAHRGSGGGDGGSSHKKTDRNLRSRRQLGGLGLAEARENRSRLSELLANTTAATTAVTQGYGPAALPSRKSQQRPSLGRSSCEERETSANLFGHWSHGAAEPRDGQRRASTTLNEVALSLSPPRKSQLLRSRKDANAAPATSKFLSSVTVGAAAATTPTKKAKKPRSSLLEGSPSMLGTSQRHQSSSPSRGSQQRANNPTTSSVVSSPGRSGEHYHLHAGASSSGWPRASAQRRPSASLGNSSASAAQDSALSAQTAKCQIRLADGAAITDMVVDLPKQICTTMRRIRNPSHVTASWQHRPTEEEMDARVLENEFEELTEEKALFFAFQRLELYVGVDNGAVTTVRCAPEWVLPDDDGLELFKLHGAAAAEKRKSEIALAISASSTAGAVGEWMAEVAMPEVVKMDAFELHPQRRLLDVHVQPITHLFLDPWLGHVWVSRQDGFVSILSTRDKQLVSRIAHPSSDAALPPPPAQEWARLQAQSIARCGEESRSRGAAFSAGGGFMGVGLECHKECKGLPPSHLTEVLPVAPRWQRALLVFTSSSLSLNAANIVDAVGSPPFKRRLSLTESSHDESVSAPLSVAAAGTALVCVDGQSDIKGDFRARQAHEWRWLQQLQQCRLDAFAACQAQRRRYYVTCEGIIRNVGHVIKELGDYAALAQLRACFHAWKDHHTLFRHTYMMRRQRTARLQREQPLARQLGHACAAQLRGAYFVRWVQLVADRRREKQDAALGCFARAAVAPRVERRRGDLRGIGHRRSCRPLPTAAMMERLRLLSTAPAFFARWRSWATETAEQRRAQRHAETEHHAYTPLLSLRRLASSPPAETTPSRRLLPSSQHSGAAEGPCAQDLVTPCRPIQSSGSGGGWEAYACSSSWTARRRLAEEELLTPSRLRVEGAMSLSLPASVEPFMAAMAELLRARVYVFHFSDARSSTTSVLDESWTVILENAESGADGDSDDERRFSVFRFALLPLLQGLLSTADDVLPNLFDNSVAEEVVSMLVGIVLAMDYVTADAECMPWLTSAIGLQRGAIPTNAGDAALGVSVPHSQAVPPPTMFDASLTVLRVYAVRAFRTDAEAADVLRGLAKSTTVLAQFLDFAMERAVARRIEQF